MWIPFGGWWLIARAFVNSDVNILVDLDKALISNQHLLIGNHMWVIIKKHALFCYYAIKRQISTKLIGENMFCMKVHQLSIVLPSKSRLVQLRIYTSYTTYFWSFVLFRCYDFTRSLYYFWTIPKTLIAQHYFCLIYI